MLLTRSARGHLCGCVRIGAWLLAVVVLTACASGLGIFRSPAYAYVYVAAKFNYFFYSPQRNHTCHFGSRTDLFKQVLPSFSTSVILYIVLCCFISLRITRCLAFRAQSIQLPAVRPYLSVSVAYQLTLMNNQTRHVPSAGRPRSQVLRFVRYLFGLYELTEHEAKSTTLRCMPWLRLHGLVQKPEKEVFKIRSHPQP